MTLVLVLASRVHSSILCHWVISSGCVFSEPCGGGFLLQLFFWVEYEQDLRQEELFCGKHLLCVLVSGTLPMSHGILISCLVAALILVFQIRKLESVKGATQHGTGRRASGWTNPCCLSNSKASVLIPLFYVQSSYSSRNPVVMVTIVNRAGPCQGSTYQFWNKEGRESWIGPNQVDLPLCFCFVTCRVAVTGPGTVGPYWELIKQHIKAEQTCHMMNCSQRRDLC